EKSSEKIVKSDESDSGNRRRRRRGGRNRHRDNANSASQSGNTSDDLSQEDNDSSENSSNEIVPMGEPIVRKRRRRRRGEGDDASPSEAVDENGVVIVTKVREARPPREPRERTRNFDRGDRPQRRDRYGNRDRDRRGRDFRNDYRSEFRGDYRENRRRGLIITEGEFLARRESVEREMLVRQKGDRTQIAVIEDKILVEHYVNRNSNISYVGNVYLGKVQNVLPSMEAAFVDIGKGRNAVLYAGEVNWDTAGLADGQPKKIEQVLKTGQPVMVQVTKDPIGQKGARLTSQISLPGRYVVYVPGGGMSGISRKLPDTERTRLKTILKNLITDEEGVIVRTSAEGASEEEITRDVARLKAQWEDIKKKSETPGVNAPSILYSEPDLTVRVIRDIFNEDFKKLTVQGDQAWDDIHGYLTHIAPELVQKIEKWTGTNDLFGEHRIDEQLSKALDRKVYLPSGGSLVIDKTEAMVVIDVNTGKFIGKGGNLEETVTKNNLEAAEEIARQLRLRDLGGIVVIDFIDMVLESNREQVMRRLIECLGRDRTKHQVAEVTSLGLVQMTRKRIGQGLIEAFSTTCESCGGRGIHIHTEPVNKRSLDRDMEKKFDDGSDDDASDSRSENDSSDDSEEENDSENAPQNEAVLDEKPRFGRRRRRATSSGVVGS
ncbi:MAG: Rne/Rng family ribonuclease, partial [Candidatus Nanopelagicaceae bacterium]